MPLRIKLNKRKLVILFSFLILIIISILFVPFYNIKTSIFGYKSEKTLSNHTIILKEFDLFNPRYDIIFVNEGSDQKDENRTVMVQGIELERNLQIDNLWKGEVKMWKPKRQIYLAKILDSNYLEVKNFVVNYDLSKENPNEEKIINGKTDKRYEKMASYYYIPQNIILRNRFLNDFQDLKIGRSLNEVKNKIGSWDVYEVDLNEAHYKVQDSNFNMVILLFDKSPIENNKDNVVLIGIEKVDYDNKHYDYFTGEFTRENIR